MFCIGQYVTQCCITVGSLIVIVTLSAHYTIHILITYYCFILLYIIILFLQLLLQYHFPLGLRVKRTQLK